MAIYQVASNQAIVESVSNGYTHEQLEEYTHQQLTNYTHAQLHGISSKKPKLYTLFGWDENSSDLKELKREYTQENTLPGSVCCFIRNGQECVYTFSNEYEWVRGSAGEGGDSGTIYEPGKNITIEDNAISLNIPVVSESEESSVENDTYFSEIKSTNNQNINQALYVSYSDFSNLLNTVEDLRTSINYLMNNQ